MKRKRYWFYVQRNLYFNKHLSKILDLKRFELSEKLGSGLPSNKYPVEVFPFGSRLPLKSESSRSEK